MSDSKVAVVEASETDLDAIASFFWEAWREAGPDALGWAGASEEVMEELTTRESILKHMGSADRRMILAKVGDRVVGFAANRRVDETVVELAGVIVLNSLLGQGIGSDLLVAAVDAARRDGYGRMIVRTEVDNERAIGFYRSRGFALGERMMDETVSVEVWELVRDLRASPVGGSINTMLR